MNITSTLKALPFLSMLAASLSFALILTPGTSMAGDNSHAQHSSQYNQHGSKMARQAHRRNNNHRVINHEQQARPHYNRGHNQHGAKKHHYRARSHYRYNQHYTHQAQHSSQAYTVTHVYQPAPVLHTPIVTHVTPTLSLSLHTGNVVLGLSSH